MFSPEVDAWAERQVDAAPVMTEATRARVEALIAGVLNREQGFSEAATSRSITWVGQS